MTRASGRYRARILVPCFAWILQLFVSVSPTICQCLSHLFASVCPTYLPVLVPPICQYKNKRFYCPLRKDYLPLFLYCILVLEQTNQTQYHKLNNLSTANINQAMWKSRISKPLYFQYQFSAWSRGSIRYPPSNPFVLFQKYF